jgi:predicted small secreted protein
MKMKSRILLALGVVLASALLTGCGIFGCAGAGGSGGNYAAGCSAAVRF